MESNRSYVYSYKEDKHKTSKSPAINYTTIDRGPPSPVPFEELPPDFPKPPANLPPMSRNVTYDYKKQMTRTTYDNALETSDMTDLLARHNPLEVLNDPRGANCTNKDVTVTVKKFTTSSDGHTTSTPYPRGRSPDKITYVAHTTHKSSDSLDRVRKHNHHGAPFPDSSPIRHPEDTKMPTRVDELMTNISTVRSQSKKIVEIMLLVWPKKFFKL